MSKELRHYVDRASFQFAEVSLVIFRKLVNLRITIEPDTQLCIHYRKAHEYILHNAICHTVGSPNHVRRAVRDTAIILKSHRVTVGTLEFAYDPDYKRMSARNRKDQFLIDWIIFHSRFNEEFSSLTLDVKILQLDYLEEEEILDILSHLKPGVLTNLVLLGPVMNEKFARLIETDHWKMAEYVDCPGFTDILNMAHFQKAFITSGTMSLNEFKQLLTVTF